MTDPVKTAAPAPPAAQSPASRAYPIARAVALFIGGFSLLNILGDLRTPGFDMNDWWIDFRPLPAWVARGLLALVSALLLTHAVRPASSRWRRSLTAVSLAIVMAVAAFNSLQVARLASAGRIRLGMPIPFSAVVTVALAGAVLSVIRSSPAVRWCMRDWLKAAGTLGICIIGFPLAQIYCFGKTDYRRPADVVVVFGARAYANGRPSDALADRVRTGCMLYKQQWAGKLVFSGGPGDGSIDEPECMRQMALSLGVPDRDILLDHQGFNTAATVANTVPVFDKLNTRRVLAVSHFYHMPRIKMSYRRAGWDVCTVPAEESYVLKKMPYLVMREVAALWVYYIRGA